MALRSEVRRIYRDHASLPIHVVGVVALALGVLHVVLDDDAVWVELLEGGILVAFAAAVFYVGHRVAVEDLPVTSSLRITATTLAGGVIVGVLAVLFLALRWQTGEPTTEAWFVPSIGWCVGVAGGSLVGYFYDQFSTSLERQRNLSKRLTVLQRVLRHNLRNEATVIAGAAGHVADHVDDPAVEDKIAVIDRHVRRIAELSENSQRLTRVWQSDQVVTFDVAEVLHEEVDRFRSERPGVSVEFDPGDGVEVRASPQFRLAIREALENAVEHNEDVEVSIAVRPTEVGVAPIDVADTGGGILASEFEPLWTSGEGPMEHTSGLGLWLIYWIVERSGGELRVRQREPSGTVLTLRLPVAR